MKIIKLEPKILKSKYSYERGEPQFYIEYGAAEILLKQYLNRELTIDEINNFIENYELNNDKE